MTGFNSIYTNAIIINGPDTDTDTDTDSIQKFIENRIPNVISIGDGKSDIMNESGDGLFFNAMHEISQQECSQTPLSKTLIVIETHGTVHEGEHVIKVTKSGISYPTKSLFEYLAQTINSPFDILMTSCHGRGAQELAELLPVGTKVAFFSNHEETTVYGDIIETISTFPENKVFSVQNFFEHFLYGMSCAVKPALVVSGEKTRSLEPAEIFQKNLISKTLSSDLKEKIKSKIDNFCMDDKKCGDQLNSKLNTLSKITDLNEIIKFPHTLSGKFHWYIDKLAILDKEVNCHKEDLDKSACMEIAAKLDNEWSSKLIEDGIPLKSTLYKVCEEEDDDSDEMTAEENEMDIKIFKDILASNNDYCAINFLGRSEFGIFEPNGKLEGDNQSEYGQYLLISSFIQQHCNQNPCPELI
jgi:hypothetical protein